MAEARPSTDEFYVGYLAMPTGMARFLRAMVVLLALSAALSAGLIAWAQRNPGGAEWETQIRTMRGVLVAQPYPVLMIDAPDARSLDRPVHARTPGDLVPVLLVDPGKFGTHGRAENLDRRRVEVRGTLLSRHNRLMLELAAEPDALRAVGGDSVRGEDVARLEASRRALGAVTLRGEIVDSKCYMGAMKPGQGKVHKACAAICVLGGIPPVLVTHDADGNVEYYLMADESGGPTGEWLIPWVGEAVEVTGTLESLGGLLVLRVQEGGVRIVP